MQLRGITGNDGQMVGSDRAGPPRWVPTHNSYDRHNHPHHPTPTTDAPRVTGPIIWAAPPPPGSHPPPATPPTYHQPHARLFEKFGQPRRRRVPLIHRVDRVTPDDDLCGRGPALAAPRLGDDRHVERLDARGGEDQHVPARRRRGQLPRAAAKVAKARHGHVPEIHLHVHELVVKFPKSSEKALLPVTPGQPNTLEVAVPLPE